MELYYIGTFNNNKIIIPFVPGRLSSKMEDKYYLINRIFGDKLTEEHTPIYDMIINAVYEGLPEYWDEVGMMLIGLHDNEIDKWANHCFKVADLIRNPGYKKQVKLVPFYSSEDTIAKFRRLMRGEVLV